MAAVSTSAPVVSVFPARAAVQVAWMPTKARDGSLTAPNPCQLAAAELASHGGFARVAALGATADIVGDLTVTVVVPCAEVCRFIVGIIPAGTKSPTTEEAALDVTGSVYIAGCADQPYVRATLAFPPGVSRQLKPTPIVEGAPKVFVFGVSAAESTAVNLQLSADVELAGRGYI